MAKYNLTAQAVTVESLSGNDVDVFLEVKDVGVLLEVIDVREAIDHYGYGDFLDEIGEDQVKEYFGLVTPEDVE